MSGATDSEWFTSVKRDLCLHLHTPGNGLCGVLERALCDLARERTPPATAARALHAAGRGGTTTWVLGVVAATLLRRVCSCQVLLWLCVRAGDAAGCRVAAAAAGGGGLSGRGLLCARECSSLWGDSRGGEGGGGGWMSVVRK